MLGCSPDDERSGADNYTFAERTTVSHRSAKFAAIIQHIDDNQHNSNSRPDHRAGMPRWLPHGRGILLARGQDRQHLRALGRK